ncbi:hypothetical protein [Bradyrhizobium sp. AZCC 2289]|uniref:hypothetical protein n=1 Tax=Bradyrhizobium sp. AZCC 2289 TaxID=3117026 RepID=UPI002FF41BB3
MPIALTGPDVAAASEADPIFALIEDPRKLRAAWQHMYWELAAAEYEAGKEHGRRPIALITWRHYHIGGSEIDDRREQLMREADIDPAMVEQEYLDAKARLQARRDAEKAWDVRAGLAVKRKEVDLAVADDQRCAERLSRTKPQRRPVPPRLSCTFWMTT